MIFYNASYNLLLMLRLVLHTKHRLRDQLYPYFLLVLFVFSAFRFEVGCDWSGYLNQFLVQGDSTISEAIANREPLWWLVLEIVDRLGLSYPWVNVVSSAIFFAGAHVLARRQPDSLGFLFLLLPILIINMPMSGIRQGAAIGLMCIAFAAFIDRKLVFFVIWTLVASLVHSSALIFLLLAPLVWGRYSRDRIVLAGLLAIPGTYFLLTGEAAELAFSRYVGTGTDAAGAVSRVAVLALSGGGFFLFLQQRWAHVCPMDYKLVTIGSLIMLGAIVVLPLSTVIADRVGYYLIPIQAVVLARIPFLFPKGRAEFLAASPYLGLSATFLVWTLFSDHFRQCYLPYQTWLLGFSTSTPL